MVASMAKWTAAIAADTPAPLLLPEPRVTFLMENDAWGRPTSSDRSYTMGVSVSKVNIATEENHNPWMNALEWVNQTLGLAAPVKANDPVGWLLASSNFTPRDITNPAPIPNDRPYASLLYGGPAYWSVRGDGSVLETELYAGLLGTGIGRSVQTWIHRQCCPDRLPQGWDNQIGKGGALTFLYHVRSIQPLPTGHETLGANVSLGWEVGYMTRLMAGASLAYGAELADRRNVALMAFSNPTYVLRAFEASAPKAGVGKGSSFWIDLEVSAIGYNQLLQGAWAGENRVRIPHREIEPIVAKINAGLELTFLFRCIGLGYESGSRLYLTQSWRTRDLRHNDETKHYWGGIVFTTPL